MSGNPFDFVVDKLGGLHNGMARCSAHDDGTRSLSVKLGDDGRVLLKCHAGCTTESVVGCRRHEDVRPVPTEEPSTGSGRIVATYDYTDEAGELLFQVVRYDPKDFRQRRRDGARRLGVEAQGTPAACCTGCPR